MFAIISLFLACGDKDNVQDSANEPTDTAETTVTTTSMTEDKGLISIAQFTTKFPEEIHLNNICLL